MGIDQVAVHVSDGSYHTTEALAADAGGSKEADFTVTYPEGYSRDAFAVYPASIAVAANYGQSGATLDVTLPGSYTLAQVSDTNTPCPMIATNTPGSGWDFKLLCGLLRLTVKAIPSDAVGMVIQFPGKKVKGTFSVTDPSGTNPTIATSASATGEDKITVYFDAGTTEATVNIPLPTGNYDDVYVTPISSNTKVAALRHIKAGGYTAARAHARKLTTTMVSFSVSGNKKVIFASGNLQAHTSNYGDYWTWRFAASQYEIIGDASGNNSVTNGGAHVLSTPNGVIDLFSYSTVSNNFGIGDRNETQSGAFRDWGVKEIGGYNGNFWRTLTEAEWQYVIGEGTNYREGGTVNNIENALCTKETINTNGTPVKGFILFPDGYNEGTPNGVNWITNYISYGGMSNSGTGGWEPTCTSAGWEALERAGCVFLPAAGVRYEKYFLYFDQGTVLSMNDNIGGFYMTNNGTPTGENTVLHFMTYNENNDDKEDKTKGGFDPNWPFLKKYGGSVRLVHEL